MKQTTRDLPSKPQNIMYVLYKSHGYYTLLISWGLGVVLRIMPYCIRHTKHYNINRRAYFGRMWQ